MTKPMITIHNTETDEILNREMTNQEYAEHLAWIEKEAKDKAELQAKEAARQAVLEKLGLTADEAAALLG